MNNIISIRDAALTYQARNGEVEALGGVSLMWRRGNSSASWGPPAAENPRCWACWRDWRRSDGGAVSLYGQPVTGASGRMGFMPQRDQLFEWRSIRDNVMLGLQIRRDRDPAHRDHVETLLKRYDLSEFAVKRPDQLSGGMRQRCALIRTLATGPDILLLDEPFSALDYQTRLAVSGDIWRIIRSEGKTALLVTHDISEAVSMSDRVVVLSRRPATVKAVFDMGELRQMDPMKRRENPAFPRYFDAIWKELELHD